MEKIKKLIIDSGFVEILNDKYRSVIDYDQIIEMWDGEHWRQYARKVKKK